MDLTTLMKQNVDNLNFSREEFKKAFDPSQRTQIYSKFVSSIENLNKIRNMKSLSQPIMDKLKEIIINASKEAESMKNGIGTVGQAPSPQNPSPSNRGQSPHNNKSAPNNDNKANDNSEDSKEKKAFEEALKGAIITEIPNVKWEDVAGLEVAKQTLKEAIIFPSKFPEIFVGLRKPWKGILLYGVN